jgi:hypothetical protein
MIIVFLLLLIDLLLPVCTIVAPGLSKKSLANKKPAQSQEARVDTKWNRGGIQFSIETR